ncbi:interferon regulatory factor 2a isoform X1 [Onychostoma macrolepis]|uniref:interferon regulatory factor 2a isoform X1 n=1 Tax=Onychostoma macrolepis TaxID=369639 RepID=UPI00272B0595|nr:interferon regulatory factor 2a isoform X1 [Onychostoma macrolepis]XP_058638572.1 interferon regulatory factor 2a isoform X1 [Onychostoma macrolepis]
MPVDRMRMRPWLEQQIESGQIQGLHWVNEEKKIFQIPWMHAARHGWDLEKDAPLFMNWAIHTGKYRPGIDKPDPKTWKANFRCAMNSLPDIEEVKDKSMKKGSNAFRMYRMLSSYEKAVKKGYTIMGKTADLTVVQKTIIDTLHKEGKKKMDLEQRAKRVFQKRKAGIPKKYKMTKEQSEENLMEETTPDSTVLFTEQESLPVPTSSVREMAVAELTDVCAVVEVATENEEPAFSSTEVCLPLQDSHVSSYSESDTESTYSEEDLVQLPQDLSLKASQRSACNSVLRIPSSAQSSPNTFFTSTKINFKVTNCREDSPLIAYNTPPWFQCLFNFQKVTDKEPSSTSPSPDLTSSPTSQASVIAKAVDLSVAKHKTLQ